MEEEHKRLARIQKANNVEATNSSRTTSFACWGGDQMKPVEDWMLVVEKKMNWKRRGKYQKENVSCSFFFLKTCRSRKKNRKFVKFHCCQMRQQKKLLKLLYEKENTKLISM